jgi:hypothetical protein
MVSLNSRMVELVSETRQEEGKMGSESTFLKKFFFFSPSQQKVFVYIIFNYYVFVLFGSAVTISSVNLTMSPQSLNEIFSQF